MAGLESLMCGHVNRLLVEKSCLMLAGAQAASALQGVYRGYRAGDSTAGWDGTGAGGFLTLQTAG